MNVTMEARAWQMVDHDLRVAGRFEDAAALKSYTGWDIAGIHVELTIDVEDAGIADVVMSDEYAHFRYSFED